MVLYTEGWLLLKTSERFYCSWGSWGRGGVVDVEAEFKGVKMYTV